VEIVERYFGAAVRALHTYWQKPRSMAEALVGGDLDRDSREVLDLMHPGAQPALPSKTICPW